MACSRRPRNPTGPCSDRLGGIPCLRSGQAGRGSRVRKRNPHSSEWHREYLALVGHGSLVCSTPLLPVRPTFRRRSCSGLSALPRTTRLEIWNASDLSSGSTSCGLDTGRRRRTTTLWPFGSRPFDLPQANDAKRLSARAVLTFAHAASVIRTQHRLQSWLNLRWIRSTVRPGRGLWEYRSAPHTESVMLWPTTRERSSVSIICLSNQ